MKKLFLATTALVALAAGPAHADPISAAAVAWIGGTLGVSAVTAGVIFNLAVSTALSAIGGAIAKSRMQRPELDVEFNVQMGDDLPLSFTVGKYATAGKRKYIGSWGKNTRFITEVIEYSALPQGLAGLWVNDERGEWESDRVWALPNSQTPGDVESQLYFAPGSVPADRFVVGRPLTNNRDNNDTTNPRIWVRAVDGTQTAADPFLTWAFGNNDEYPWTSAMVGRGKSYVIVTSQYDKDTQTQYPTWLFKPAPLPVYDWRFDSTNGGVGPQRWGDRSTYQPSLNPAVLAYNIARGIYYGSEWVFGGKNLAAWRLPVAEWTAAANACDQTVTLANGSTQPRYRAGAEIKVDMEPASVLEELGKAANMKFAEVGGRLKPVVDLPGAAVFSFTDGDILITEGQSFNPFYPVSETFNAISATYPEPGEKWASKDAPEFVDAAATADDGEQYLPTSMQYGAVPFARQVQRLMRSQMRDFRRMRRHQFYLPPDAYALEPGIDMVSWTSERNGYVNKLFMVESVNKTPGMNVLVSLREVDPSDYDWSSDFEQPVVITPPANPRPFVQPANGFAVAPAVIEDASTKARRPAILATYTGSEAGVREIRMQARLAGTVDVVFDTLRPWNAAQKWLLHDVLPATAYEVQAQLISDLTPQREWSPWHPVTTPDVGFSWEDWDAQLRDEIQADLAKADQAAADALEALNRSNEVRSDLNTAVADLNTRADTLAQEAIDNLNIARNYTDTSLVSESDARVAGDQALASQIQTLTAVLNSENYLENARFSDGLTGWIPSNASATSVVDQDDASADPIIANAPTARFMQIVPTSAGARSVRQDFGVEWVAGEVFQWRVQAAAPDGREAQTRVFWYNSSGAQIGSVITNPLALTAGAWKIFSGQHVPPEGTASIRFELRQPATPSAGPVSFADVSFTKVDQSLIARIADLEVVVANNEEAFTLHRNSANSRLDANEAAIAQESTTRSTQFGSISNQLTTVSATANSKSATFRQSSAPISPAVGDVWYNTADENKAYRWSGIGGGAYDWLPVTDSRVVSLTATVSTQATAIADLEAGAQAGYLIKVKAGGAVSLLDLIAADGSGGEPTSIAKIAATDIILDGSVSMNQLVVADLSNLVRNDWTNGDFDGWATSYTNYTIENRQDAPFQSVKGFLASFNGGDEWVRSKPFPARVDEEYLVEINVLRSGATPPNGTSSLVQMRWETDTGATYTSVGSVSSGGLQKVSGIVKAPANAVTGSMWVRPNVGGTSGLVYLARPIIRRATDAVLISDGGVIARHVTADTMRALNGRFSDLAAANIKVGNAEIKRGNIEDLAVDSAKIANLSVERIKIANGSVSTYERAFTAGSGPLTDTIQSLTYTIGRAGPQTLNISFNTGVTLVRDLSVNRIQNGNITRVYRGNIAPGPLGDVHLTVTDSAMVSGAVRYEYAATGYDGQATSAQTTNRFLGAMNVFK